MAIGAFGLADLVCGRQRLKTVMLTLLSASFLVIWSLLSSGGDGGGSYADYFAHWQPNLTFFTGFWSELLEFLPLAWYRIGAAAAALLFIAGAVDLWRSDRRAALALAAYLAGFAALHVVWPFPGADYLVMASWAALLFIFAGLFALLRWDERYRTEGLSNYMSFISGPSKTADIEAIMVHGAHGPREVHLFVVTG